jgi:hypothetical protein
MDGEPLQTRLQGSALRGTISDVLEPAHGRVEGKPWRAEAIADPPWLGAGSVIAGSPSYDTEATTPIPNANCVRPAV